MVDPAAVTSCTAALRLGGRFVVPDFEAWDEIAGTDDLLAFRRAGIRAAQTTPLMARDGRLLGMISTHWAEAHEPTERDLRLLDILRDRPPTCSNAPRRRNPCAPARSACASPRPASATSTRRSKRASGSAPTS